ncbi:hypothetical protein [Microbacterium aurum]
MSAVVNSSTVPVSTASRRWAATGVASAIGSLASVFLSMSLSPEYIPGSVITSEAIDAGLMAERPSMIAFHIVTLASAGLLMVFAAGLHRRLTSALPSASLVPLIAFSGLLLVVAAQMLGTGLDTEFLFGIGDSAINLPSDIGFYSHWIATIPWLWFGGGVAALAVGAARRHGGVSGWLGITSTILGALTLLLAIAPLQYMAAGPGALWLLIAAIGFSAESRTQPGSRC